MESISFGVLTVSDRCARRETLDESGPNLVNLITNGIIIPNCVVVETAIVPDSIEEIQKKLKEWCDEHNINVIITTGGTGVAETDVTPEATKPLLHKNIPGISNLIFKKSSKVTPLAALSRGICGIRGRSLLMNFPGSKKASQECFEAVADVIHHAVDLIRDIKPRIESVHIDLKNDVAKSKVDPGNIVYRKRQSSYPLRSVEEAQEIIEKVLNEVKNDFEHIKIVSLGECFGHVLAETITAIDQLPPFPASTKDGYAVVSSDPATVKTVLGSSSAGDSACKIYVTPQYCARVNTGAFVPSGADAVIQVENTELLSTTEDGREENKISFKKLASMGENIRQPGSDLNIGEVVLEKGVHLDPCALGILAASGTNSVKVYAKPKIGILSTGNELQNPEEALLPGKIRDSNRIAILSLLKDQGFPVLDLGIAKDSPDDLYKSLKRGFEKVDIVITSGGVSMGEKDFLKKVLVLDFDAEIHFGRVRMKPGMPTAFASLQMNGKAKLWFGLPGNPVSTMVTSLLFVLPALKKISGYRNQYFTRIKVKLMEELELDERPEYRRAILSYAGEQMSVLEMPQAFTTGNQISSRLLSCIDANCLLELPPRSNSLKIMEKGSIANALLIKIP